MILNYLIMYIKTLIKSINKVLAKAVHHHNVGTTSLCSYIKPGILECDNNVVVALFRVKDWVINIHDLTQLDYVHNMRKFLEILYVENCREILLTDIELVDVDKYFKKIDRDLQMKFVELSVDKANVKLRNYIEKVLEVRKKVLMGIKPIKALNIVALVCSSNVNLKDVEKIPLNAKNMLNMYLEPVLEDRLAEILLNFCKNRST